MLIKKITNVSKISMRSISDGIKSIRTIKEVQLAYIVKRNITRNLTLNIDVMYITLITFVPFNNIYRLFIFN